MSSLQIGHLNIQSIRNKLDELKHFIAYYNLDILSLNETHLKPSHKISIPNFNIIRLDRQNKNGGGVCVIIRSTIDYNQIFPGDLADEEAIILEFPTISIHHDRLIFASYYSPPNKTISKELTENIFKLSENVLLVGDLNAHHEDWLSSKSNQKGRIVSNLLETHNLVLVNSPEPTYLPLHNTSYSAILDLIITTESMSENISNFRTTDLLHSDHVSVLIQLNAANTVSTSSEKKKKQIKISKIDNDNLENELIKNSPDYLELNNTNDIEKLSEQITEAITNSVINSTSIKTIKINDSSLFLPRHIVDLIKVKRKIRRKYQSSRDPSLKTMFNSLCTEIKMNINEFKARKWQDFCSTLNQFTPSDSKLWKKLNSIDKESKPSPNPKLLINGQLIKEPALTSNIFADELEKVFQNHEDPNFDQSFAENVTRIYPDLFSSSTPFSDFPKTNVAEI